MTTAAIKAKLHDFIEEADDKKLELIYSLFEDKSAPAVNWWEDEEVVAELDERFKRWEDGLDPSYSVADVKASLEKLKAERYGKSN